MLPSTTDLQVRDQLILELAYHQTEAQWCVIRDWYLDNKYTSIAKVINLMLYFNKFPSCNLHMKSTTNWSIENIDHVHWYFERGQTFREGLSTFLYDLLFKGTGIELNRSLHFMLHHMACKLEGFMACLFSV